MISVFVIVPVPALLAFGSRAMAHPHMFIDTRLELFLGDGTLEKLEIT